MWLLVVIVIYAVIGFRFFAADLPEMFGEGSRTPLSRCSSSERARRGAGSSAGPRPRAGSRAVPHHVLRPRVDGRLERGHRRADAGRARRGAEAAGCGRVAPGNRCERAQPRVALSRIVADFRVRVTDKWPRALADVVAEMGSNTRDLKCVRRRLTSCRDPGE